MPTSVRVAVVIVVLGGWIAVIAATLLEHKLPDVTLLAVPGAVLVAASPLPGKFMPRKRTPAKRAPKKAADKAEDN